MLKHVVGAVAVIVMLSACGGDDGAENTVDEPSSDVDTGVDDDADTGVDPPTDDVATTPGGEGTITLNGEATAVTEVHRCIPFRDEPGNLDLTAFMEAGGYTIVYVGDGGTALKDISLNNVDEAAFGSGVFASDLDTGTIGTFAVDGNHISGSGTVYDAYESGASVDVTFEFSFPDEAEDCSL